MMGVDVSHIVKNKFFESADKIKSRAYLESVCQKLQDFFHNKNAFEVFIENCDESDYTKEIHTRLYSVDIELFDGFFDIESYFRYHQLFSNVENEPNQFWLRNFVFDFVRALGETTAYHCSEYHSWNCVEELSTFGNWYKREKENINTFEPNKILERIKSGHFDYDDVVYFDTFDDCRQLLKQYQAMFPDYTINTLLTLGNSFLIGIQNNHNYLLDFNTKQMFSTPEFDGYANNLNSNFFVLSNNEKRSLFSPKGKQLTEFKQGDFLWQWKEVNCSSIVEIVDEETKQIYYSMQ